MPFQVSPGVNISEVDLTTSIPSVATTEGAIAGVFRWGPVNQRILIESENELVERFGKPDATNFETFFTASSFLAYGNKLYVVRAADITQTFNAIATAGTVANVSAQAVTNLDNFNSKTFDANTNFVAKYPGILGNSLKVSVCPSANAFSQLVNIAANSVGVNAAVTNASISVGTSQLVIAAANAAQATLLQSNVFANGDVVRIGNASMGFQELRVVNSSITSANLTLNLNTTYKLSTSVTNVALSNTTGLTFERNWEYFKSVAKGPGTSPYALARGGAGDELHIVVADEDGAVTGVPGAVLEVFEDVSRAVDAVNESGSTLFYRTVIAENSKYIWATANVAAGITTGTNASSVTAVSANVRPITLSFSNGASGDTESSITPSALMTGYDYFKSSEDVDVSLILAGKPRGGTSNTAVANYIIDNICEDRKDCVVFVSPERGFVVPTGAAVDITTNLVSFRNSLTNSSYAFLDSGYKYCYDRYNDTYRYVPLNGDIAGLAVRTDSVRDPWFSPAGFNRGIIKNIVKLAYNPSKADRDILYKNDINPVVTFPGQGTVLYGDKTLLGRPSAFDRINVRRLFIVLQKAIGNASKFTLFEFNDAFTRAQFVNLVDPFLRDVLGRRGITDYRVVCDETNNTPEVIDRNEFVGDIYIKPARSINYIQLNFVAVRTGVEFTEIVGQF